MIHHITRLLFTVLIFIGIYGCSSDNVKDSGMSAGKLSVAVEVDDRIDNDGGSFSSDYLPGEDLIAVTMSSLESGATHTWSDISDFPQGQYYLSGPYRLEGRCGDVELEGYDIPAFYGETVVHIENREETNATIGLSLANALVKVVYSDAVRNTFESVEAFVHTPGGMYHAYPETESRMLCLRPSELEMILDVKLSDGRAVSFTAYSIQSMASATLYTVYIDCETTLQGPRIIVSQGDNTTSTLLSDEFISAGAPTVIASWRDDAIIKLPEGNRPDDVYSVDIASSVPLSSVVLSTRSRSLLEQGLPQEIDLLHPDPEQAESMSALGLDYMLTSTGGKIEFNGLLGNLVYLDEASAESTFTIIAIGDDGKTSDPVSLVVHTTPVEIEVVKTYDVTMGIDRAGIEVKCTESGFIDHVEIEVATTAEEWTKVSPLQVESLGNDLYRVEFDVATGSTPVKARILYCREVRSTLDIPRRMPEFSIEVDAYATMAAVKIIPADPSLLETITSRASVYINGSEAPVFHVLPEQGILSVIGLSPLTVYSFKATMMSGVDAPEFTPEVRAMTEATPQLPNADFEERTDGVKYKNLASGGRYSQTVVEIFNWQHHATIDQEIPKQWANTNAKTFAMASDIHNTWYMQPSVALTRAPVFSQSFAVELTSVAFDPHGKPIKDYTQTGQPYLDYSPIVPEIAYKAAGKLFLGQYAFDPATMTETYAEGIEWNARPSSLNGYYRYFPVEADRSDCGLVTVEVMGYRDDGEVVIASGSQRLALALSYTAFNVPLTYTYFGVKATRIKVMFSSSVHSGSIADESSSVITVPNPVSASSTGGKLWIDNITLAY